MPEPLTIRPATRADVSHLVDWNAAMARETEAKTLDRAVLSHGVEGVFDDPRRGFPSLGTMRLASTNASRSLIL